jgi:hypothetical protein
MKNKNTQQPSSDQQSQYGQQPPSPYGQQPPSPYGQQPPTPYAQQPLYGQQPPYGNNVYPQPGASPAYPVYVTTAPTGNGLGVAALIVGVIALIGSWIPFLNVVSLVFAIVALLLAICGIIVGAVKKRTKGSAIAGLILAIISIIIFAGMTAATVAVVDELTHPSSPSSGTNSSVATKQADENTITALGMPTSTAKFEITVNGSSTTERIDNGDFMHYEPDAGNVYAVVNITLKNISNQMESFDNSDFQLLSLDGNIKYSPTSIMITSGEETFFWMDSMNPGLSKTGNVVFELPQGIDLSTLKMQYNDTWSFDVTKFNFAIQ